MRRLDPTSSAARTPRLVLVAFALGFAFAFATGCRSRPAQVLSAPESTAPIPVADVFARDVELLKSADFVERSHAAERLVAAGERALAALGAAGEGTVRALGAQEVGTTAPVLRTILSEIDFAGLARYLDAPWPVVRRETADELGRRGRWSAVPHLIPCLDDRDASVRAASASSLRRLTNQFFGFDAGAHLQARRRATGRWREWWSVEGRVRAAEGERGGAG